MENKKFWQSKTFYFALLSLVVGAAGVFGFAEYQPSGDMVEIGALVNGVLILVLRVLTNKGIKF